MYKGSEVNVLYGIWVTCVYTFDATCTIECRVVSLIYVTSISICVRVCTAECERAYVYIFYYVYIRVYVCVCADGRAHMIRYIGARVCALMSMCVYACKHHYSGK